QKEAKQEQKEAFPHAKEKKTQGQECASGDNCMYSNVKVRTEGPVPWQHSNLLNNCNTQSD
ncbi:unnamed protein product, partial [Allacma fusca]